MMARVCGFAALRCWLTILNVFYISVGMFLIGLAIAARLLAYFTSTPILIGIALCGSILVIVAAVGLIGTIKHHQVTLFFYMVILGLSGVAMFSVSVATLAIPENLQESFFESTWRGLSAHDKQVIQEDLNCCGFNNATRYFTIGVANNGTVEEFCEYAHPRCNTSSLTRRGKCCHDYMYNESTPPLYPDPEEYKGQNCTEEVTCRHCDPCYSAWEKAVSKALWVAGSFGLAFSFTHIVGIVLSFMYRNQKDPNANPSAFL